MATKNSTHFPEDLSSNISPAIFPPGSADDMVVVLRQWRDLGWLSALDSAFAEFLRQHVPDISPLALLAGALVSNRAGRGDLLLDLDAAKKNPRALLPQQSAPGVEESEGLVLPEDLLQSVTLESWIEALRDASSVCETVAPALKHEHPYQEVQRRPLVLDGTKLYLRRYWQYERDVGSAISQKIQASRKTDETQLTTLLAQLFDTRAEGSGPTETDWQKVACAIAAKQLFSVITGGPGTGKTTTVVKLLALLQAMALNSEGGAGSGLRIRLAAPTGKAAARLNESIAGQVELLPVGEMAQGESIRAMVPTEVTTLHRLLGARPKSRLFEHHKLNPLPVDLVVVDEASMVDLEMLANLLDAIPQEAGLILLGDKDQLASVEAGAVLGSLCAQAKKGHYSADTKQWIERVTTERLDESLVCEPARRLDQCVAMLRHSYRFGMDSGIGLLAQEINKGSAAGVRRVLSNPTMTDIHQMMVSDSDHALRKLAVFGIEGRGVGYANYLRVMRDMRPASSDEKPAFDAWAITVLEAHTAFQLLCAVRHGPFGVEGMTPRIEQWLASDGFLPQEAAAGAQWYEGRPVLVTGNDYSLKLMNGDIGIAMTIPVGTNDEGETVSAMRVAFPSGDGAGGVRWVLPSRLQRVETVFAMTVHKSQGSEFEHTALMLPDAVGPVATRELFYTAVTRAKKMFTLIESDHYVTDMVTKSQVRRASGLFTKNDGEQ